MQNEAMAIIPIDKTEDNEIMVGGNRFSDDVWDFNDYVSVSYTHLDVYKRQMIICLRFQPR